MLDAEGVIRKRPLGSSRPGRNTDTYTDFVQVKGRKYAGKVDGQWFMFTAEPAEDSDWVKSYHFDLTPCGEFTLPNRSSLKRWMEDAGYGYLGWSYLAVPPSRIKRINNKELLRLGIK